MDFAAAIKAGFVNTFNFKGTATRPEFWYFFLFNWLITQVIQVIDFAVNPALREFYFQTLVSDSGTVPIIPDVWSLMPWVTLFVGLVTFLPNLSIVFRRLRDSGRNGKLALLQFIPLLAILVVLGFALAILSNAYSVSSDLGMGLAVVILLALFGVLALQIAWFVLWIIWMVSPTKTAAQGNRFAQQ